jgi:hypothetical protein
MVRLKNGKTLVWGVEGESTGRGGEADLVKQASRLIL